MADPTPFTLGRTHARDTLREEAERRGRTARAQAERCTGENRDYWAGKAEGFEWFADKLRQRGERG